MGTASMAHTPQTRRVLVSNSFAAWCTLLSHNEALRSEDMLPAAKVDAALPDRPPEQLTVLPADASSSRRTALFDFDVPFRGEPMPIAPFLGQASIMVNVKYDDPITLDQLPGLQVLVNEYSSQGLHVLAFPTDQGWF